MDLLAKIKEMNKAKKNMQLEASGNEETKNNSQGKKQRKENIKVVKAKIIQFRIREWLERQTEKRSKKAEIIKRNRHPIDGSKYCRLLYAHPGTSSR